MNIICTCFVHTSAVYQNEKYFQWLFGFISLCSRQISANICFRNDSETNEIVFCRSMRWRLVVDTEMERDTADGTQHIPAYLSSTNSELFNDVDGDLEDQIDLAVDTVNRRLSDFEGQGSGWRLSCIDRVAIHCSKHSPITGSSYIPTPKSIESRRAILNVHKHKWWSLLFIQRACPCSSCRSASKSRVQLCAFPTQTRLFWPHISSETATN